MVKLHKISIFIILVAMIAMPLASFAAVNINVNVNTGGTGGGDVLPPGIIGNPATTGAGGLSFSEILDIITTVANYLLVVGMIIAVIMIVWGGIRYTTAGGDSKKADAARDIIKNGIIGAIVVLGVGVILNTAAALVNRAFFS